MSSFWNGLKPVMIFGTLSRKRKVQQKSLRKVKNELSEKENWAQNRKTLSHRYNDIFAFLFSILWLSQFIPENADMIILRDIVQMI